MRHHDDQGMAGDDPARRVLNCSVRTLNVEYCGACRARITAEVEGTGIFGIVEAGFLEVDDYEAFCAIYQYFTELSLRDKALRREKRIASRLRDERDAQNDRADELYSELISRVCDVIELEKRVGQIESDPVWRFYQRVKLILEKVFRGAKERI
jgi:hypothetical protein